VTEQARFAHASEAELARILDYYGVTWQYEPRTFPIMWSLDGRVVESFSPDFYLPDLNLYVELTTLKQSLVRRKNRKLRRLRALYPDIRIKLFYGKDFRALMLKYGRFDLAASLSGLEGQVAADLANSQPRLGVVIAKPGQREETRELAAAPAVGTNTPQGTTSSRSRVSRGSRRRRGRRLYAEARTSR
jgi:hypoxanthine phosphoribosyltransferase